MTLDSCVGRLDSWPLCHPGLVPTNEINDPGPPSRQAGVLITTPLRFGTDQWNQRDIISVTTTNQHVLLTHFIYKFPQHLHVCSIPSLALLLVRQSWERNESCCSFTIICLYHLCLSDRYIRSQVSAIILIVWDNRVPNSINLLSQEIKPRSVQVSREDHSHSLPLGQRCTFHITQWATSMLTIKWFHWHSPFPLMQLSVSMFHSLFTFSTETNTRVSNFQCQINETDACNGLFLM